MAYRMRHAHNHRELPMQTIAAVIASHFLSATCAYQNARFRKSIPCFYGNSKEKRSFTQKFNANMRFIKSFVYLCNS